MSFESGSNEPEEVSAGQEKQIKLEGYRIATMCNVSGEEGLRQYESILAQVIKDNIDHKTTQRDGLYTIWIKEKMGTGEN